MLARGKVEPMVVGFLRQLGSHWWQGPSYCNSVVRVFHGELITSYHILFVNLIWPTSMLPFGPPSEPTRSLAPAGAKPCAALFAAR